MKKTGILFITLFISLFSEKSFAAFSDVDELIHQKGVEYVVEKKIMSGFSDGSFRPTQQITRAELASSLMKSGILISLIDSCTVAKSLRDVPRKSPDLKAICRVIHRRVMTLDSKGRFRPHAPVSLAEAAKAISKAFTLPVKEVELSPYGEESAEGPHWYTQYLLALEYRSAIPKSFASARDFVTREELAEMISRLKEDDQTRPSKTARDLEYGMRFGGKYEEMFRVYGDLKKPFPENFIHEDQFQSFFRPATYSIIDVDLGNDDLNCHRFTVFETNVVADQSKPLPDSFAVMLIGEASDACIFPRDDIPKYSCPDENKPDVEQFCNMPLQKPYTLSIIKENGEIRFEGLDGGEVLRIDREDYIQPLPYEVGSKASYYEIMKVDTQGSLSTSTLSNGETVYTYKTPWQKIFQDLRGMGNIAVKKILEDGKYSQRIHFDPIHNRNSYGRGIASYENCIKNWVSPLMDLDMKFCIKTEAGKFVISSRLELSENLIFWIDPHFKR